MKWMTIPRNGMRWHVLVQLECGHAAVWLFSQEPLFTMVHCHRCRDYPAQPFVRLIMRRSA